MKTIETTKCEICFIREIEEQMLDLREHSAFAKNCRFGLTKGENRFSEYRLGDHQIGNAHMLEMVARVATACVSTDNLYE